MTVIDSVLGRVSMYRLETVALVIVAVTALVLSFAGALFYSPAELAASLVVACGATVGSGWLVARLLRRRPHLESSLITGLLLFFLFWPTTDVALLAALVVAGVVASVSKHLIAVNGRHLLNPAAVAAIAVTLMGLDASVWWVASAELLWVVAPLAVLIVLRVREAPTAAVFLLISTVLIAIRLTESGSSPLEALITAVVSYPGLFLAAFMLTEPLTLPPRRWQRLVVAAVVAVAFATPVTIGPVHLTPEVALLLGNLVAFALAARVRAVSQVRLVESRSLGGDLVEYRFVSPRPMLFAPGQWVELTVPHRQVDSRGSRRVFSIASPPGQPDVTILMRQPEKSSSFKRALAQLSPGAEVRVASIGGDFVVPRKARPLLMVSGGIGITPFASQAAALAASGDPQRDVVLLHVGSEAVPYREHFEQAGARIVTVARADLDPGRLRVLVPDIADRHVAVSGPPAFVSAAGAALRAAGARRVRRDSFSGY